MNDESIQRAAELITQADGLLVAAGAGMGVDSGLPDFRGPEGFWKAYPALGIRSLDFEDMASPGMFLRDPALAWGFYGHRLAMYRAAQPHLGFELLRQWGLKMPHGCFVNTSNVDGQFQKAGFEPFRVCEIHGSLHRLQCLDRCTDDAWEADAFVPQIDDTAGCLIGELPRCLYCGRLARPNVLMFNDYGWVDERTQMQRAFRDSWLTRTQRPVVVELGAGTAIPTIRVFSEYVCRHRGGQLIRINPTASHVPAGMGVGLSMGALAGLRAMAALLDA